VSFSGSTMMRRLIDMADERQPLQYYLDLEYPYTVVPDDGSYFIRFPDLPGCMTQVEDPAEIAALAEEIRTLWIEGEYEDGRTFPSVARCQLQRKIPAPSSKSLTVTWPSKPSARAGPEAW